MRAQKQYPKAYKKRDCRGFTLIEMLVAVALFVVIMLTVGSAVLSVLEGNRKAQATELVMNNLNFAMETIVRSLRVGSMYHCDVAVGLIDVPRDCSGGASSIAFESSGGDRGTIADQVIYQLRNNTIERSYDGGSNFVPMTAPEVVVESVQFHVVGASGAPDTNQPRVLVRVQGRAGVSARVETRFDIQTTVAQRSLDVF